MNEPIHSYVRGKQILKLLNEHGSLSVRGLRACIYPKMNERRLTDTLQRLCKNQLIVKHYDRIIGRKGAYYSITNDEIYWPKIAKKTSLELKAICPPFVRYAELIHSEECAIWAERLKRLLPGAKVLREFALNSDPLALRALLVGKHDFELRPDILILAPSKQTSKTVRIAVEVEKTRKSEKRLLQKLRKYANRTLMDGIIYVCDSDSLRSKLREVYNSKVHARAIRINHYGDNFFLFSDRDLDSDPDSLTLLNAGLKPVYFKAWMHTLTHTEPLLRRNPMFESQPSAG